MRVIGTAGHVDHGKSTLVLALTGINPDRLREEQERQMTIDLGFAWMKLPDGDEIGIVDVPGHRDFIENMLAGVGGIDAALLVVAADEGVMPQTREHLEILDLLEVSHGVVALTKIDLIDEIEWLQLVEEELRGVLRGTSLSDMPIVRVSARTRSGLEALQNALANELAKSAPRLDLGRPRLPIDRVFSITGFGTIVTGTLMDGAFRLGDEVAVLPKGLKAKIRGLQTHKAKVEIAVPGSRTAINLTGIEVRELERGFVVAAPGKYQPTKMMDAHYRHLESADQPLKHDMQVKLFIGAAQQMARIRLLGTDQIKPGEEGWLQLVLEEKVVATRGDHYILRRPSPGRTLGGGRVADPHPQRRHRRRNDAILLKLKSLLRGTPAEILAQSLISLGPVRLNDSIRNARLEDQAALAAAKELFDRAQLVLFDEREELRLDSLAMHIEGWHALSSEAVGIMKDFHNSNPLRSGMLREEFKSRLRLSNAVFSPILDKFISEGVLESSEKKIALSGHRPKLSQEQQHKVRALLQQFNASAYAPPSVKACLQDIGQELFNYLIEQSYLIQVAEDVVFDRATYDVMLNRIREIIQGGGSATVAEVRDVFNTSRKYALALMEHLDAIGITIRDGDERRLAEEARSKNGQ